MKKILVFLFILCFATSAFGWSVKNIVDIYVIKANVIGAGGTIVPKGEVNVDKGKNQAFYFVPYEGYAVHDVIIDGKSLLDMDADHHAWEMFTFTEVDSDHTIDVVFKRK
jgi:hypothetical protein